MTRQEIPLDAAAILRVLTKHRVDYMVIGGLAVQAHGHPRTTQDLDLVPEPSAANLERLRAALEEGGARPVGAPKRQSVKPPGAAPYPALSSRALTLELEAQVLVAGIDDLIAMKRATGRPIDRSDIVALTEPPL